MRRLGIELHKIRFTNFEKLQEYCTEKNFNTFFQYQQKLGFEQYRSNSFKLTQILRNEVLTISNDSSAKRAIQKLQEREKGCFKKLACVPKPSRLKSSTEINKEEEDCSSSKEVFDFNDVGE